MVRALHVIALVLSAVISLRSSAQAGYQYNVNLNNLLNDELKVELVTPPVKKATAIFSFPKILPGTYGIADYGKFVKDVKAFDKSGKALTIKQLNTNQWQVTNATRLAKITYSVEDIFDTKQQHKVYPMAATNFEEGKNFVLNLPGIFGYLDGLRNVPFQFSFQKPQGFYASTSLQPVSSTTSKDVFKADNLDAMYDYPIMYGIPDTASVYVGNTQVLVSVYSPNKMVHAKDIAGWMRDLLEASRKYLGGKLPAEKYAFLYYFNDAQAKHSFEEGMGGALEHPTSSFYYLWEAPANVLQKDIVDISAHEFFHIITPLTIASKEIKEFNFNKAILSKHLWLYEGVTEYTSHHVQVKYGLNTVQEFLNKLSQKITNSRKDYNDSLPFTVMSKEAAGKYADQYNNVYEKGALIAACLDIYLLHLSNGNYGLRNLTYDLGVRFGKYRYFNDDELFDNIAELTYPEIKTFLLEYVSGPTPIPYEYFFGLAGIQFQPKVEVPQYTFGGILLKANSNNVVTVNHPFNPNEFGKKLGYKEGDEIYEIQGREVTPANLNELITTTKLTMKEGAPFIVKIGRKNTAGIIDTLTLQALITTIPLTELNKLSPLTSPTQKQLLVQRAWLTTAKAADTRQYAANPADVESIDAIVKAVYDVISGPAGPRNWDRFHSLFLPEGQMGAIGKNQNGQPLFRVIQPENYARSNAPFFMASGFYEQELKRNVAQFGNIASVQSSYQFRFTPNGKIEQRGVNYLTLVKSNGRWWIANLSWQDEGQDLPLPQDLQ